MKVASRREAWIEISNDIGLTQRNLVASRREAWIEIGLKALPIVLSCVASRREVWIEIYNIPKQEYGAQ